MIQDKRFVIRTCLVDKDENSGQLNYDFRTKTGSNWFDSVFSDLTWFFRFGSGFFQFFSVFLVSVRFGFFSFGLIKSKSNWSVILKF
jgi:hypothetical protein